MRRPTAVEDQMIDWIIALWEALVDHQQDHVDGKA
jgi:hypothetical protein